MCLTSLLDEWGTFLDKLGFFLGLTSGAFLTGFSIGMLHTAEDYQPNWLSLISGMVGITMLGFTTNKFWTKEEETDI